MVSPTSDVILERIHLVLGNLVRTFNIKEKYADEDDPWLVIFDAESFQVSQQEIYLKVIVRVN